MFFGKSVYQISNDLSLICRSCDDYPLSTITWLDGSDNVIETVTGIQGQNCTSLELTFLDLDLTNHNSTYKCRAENGIPPIEEKVVVIEVYGKIFKYHRVLMESIKLVSFQNP